MKSKAKIIIGFAMTANLNVASSKMSAMLCCSGEKDSVGRDLKSAQNTPSRQPLQPPYTMGQGQFMAPNQQQQNTALGQNRLPQHPSQQQQQQMYGGPNARMMNPMSVNNFAGPNAGGPMGQPKDDYRKVCNFFLNFFKLIGDR